MTTGPPITKEMIEGSPCRNASHYNMGPKGYGYGYRFDDFPRLMFIDKHYRKERRNEREWFVDGARVADFDAAIVALNAPAVLTDDEKEILAKIPLWFTPLREIEDQLVGVPHPEGAIMPDTPHSSVKRLLSQLRDKGVIEYGQMEVAPSPQALAVGVRSSTAPTIRRRSE